MASPQPISKSEQKASESYTLNAYLYSASSTTEILAHYTRGGTSKRGSDLQSYVDGLTNVIKKDEDKKTVMVKL